MSTQTHSTTATNTNLDTDTYPGLRSRISIDPDDHYTGTLEELIHKVDPNTVALWIYFYTSSSSSQTLSKETFAHLPNLKILGFEYGDEIIIDSLPESIEVLINESNDYYLVDKLQSEFSKKNKIDDCYINLNLPNLKYIQSPVSCCHIPRTVKHYELVLYNTADIYDAKLIVQGGGTTSCTITFANVDRIDRGMVFKFFPEFFLDDADDKDDANKDSV